MKFCRCGNYGKLVPSCLSLFLSSVGSQLTSLRLDRCLPYLLLLLPCLVLLLLPSLGLLLLPHFFLLLPCLVLLLLPLLNFLLLPLFIILFLLPLFSPHSIFTVVTWPPWECWRP